MKTTGYFLVLMMLLLWGSARTGESGKRYGMEKACIEYTITGTMQSGTETLYFDQWGAREAKYTTMAVKVAGFSQETKSATFTEGDWIYSVNLATNTGTKTRNNLFDGMSENEKKEMGLEMMKKMGGKKIGQEKVLGKTCDVWEIPSAGSKTWLWNWIPLKTEVNMGGMKLVYEARKISTTFDPAKLNKPDNVKYSDMGNVNDLLKGFQRQ